MRCLRCPHLSYSGPWDIEGKNVFFFFKTFQTNDCLVSRKRMNNAQGSINKTLDIETNLVCQCCIQLNLASGAAGVVLLLLQNRLPQLVFPTRRPSQSYRSGCEDKASGCAAARVSLHTSNSLCQSLCPALRVSLGAKGALEENDGQKPCRYIFYFQKLHS